MVVDTSPDKAAMVGVRMALSHPCPILGGMETKTSTEISAVGPVVAADTVGAPLSEFARLAMRHEPAIDVAVPGDLADQLACAGRRWDVPTGVAAAWLLAEGTARLLAAEETDPLDWRHTGLPHLDFAGPDGVDYSVDLQVDIPSAEMWVALRRLAKSFDTDPQDIARIGLVWGLARLHDKDDSHNCATHRSANTTGESRPPLGDSGGLNPQEAAVLAEVPLQPLALMLLAPKQVLALSLPEFTDDWLLCIARRWRTPASVTATWLLADGAAILMDRERRRDTAWRNGPTRWVVPTQGGPRPRRHIEIPGEWLQTILGRLAAATGADQEGIVTLTVTVGADLWQTHHGCVCGPRHTPGVGE